MSTLQHLQILDINEQSNFLNRKTRVFADFHNADTVGRIRLNCIGTIEDLATQGIRLQSGQELTLYSEELEVDGIVEYSQLENIFVVVIDWDKIREVEELGAKPSVADEVIKRLRPNKPITRIPRNSYNLPSTLSPPLHKIVGQAQVLLGQDWNPFDHQDNDDENPLLHKWHDPTQRD
jgi:hypothetical protein